MRVVVLAALFIVAAQCATISLNFNVVTTLTNLLSLDFSSNNIWSGNVAPTAADDVVIAYTGLIPVNIGFASQAQARTVNSLVVQGGSGATSSVSVALNSALNIATQSSIKAGGTLILNANAVLDGAGSLVVESGGTLRASGDSSVRTATTVAAKGKVVVDSTSTMTFDNNVEFQESSSGAGSQDAEAVVDGTMHFSSSAVATFRSGSHVHSSGSSSSSAKVQTDQNSQVVWESSSSFASRCDTAYENSGETVIRAKTGVNNAVATQFNSATNAYTQASGKTRIESNAAMQSASDVNFNGGSVEGFGKIIASGSGSGKGNIKFNGNTVVQGGDDSSEGQLSLQGAAQWSSSTTTKVRVKSSSEASKIFVSNTASMSGKCEVITDNNANLKAGDSFEIVNANDIQGSFSSVDDSQADGKVQVVTQASASGSGKAALMTFISFKSSDASVACVALSLLVALLGMLL